ncbi:MAG: hypothetical protein AABW51_02190 [Nanoarchaeota archaeon]
MALEDKFNQAVSEWREHCKNNSFHSVISPYLDCEAYRNIIAMGPAILPLIRDQLKKEIEIGAKYETELKRIKIKVFGTDSVKLCFGNYDKIREDAEYNQYTECREESIGNAGFKWCYAIKTIVPEFGLPIGEKDSGAPIEKVAQGFIGLKVDDVQKATIKWLDDNMSKYVPAH